MIRISFSLATEIILSTPSASEETAAGTVPAAAPPPANFKARRTVDSASGSGKAALAGSEIERRDRAGPERDTAFGQSIAKQRSAPGQPAGEGPLGQPELPSRILPRCPFQLAEQDGFAVTLGAAGRSPRRAGRAGRPAPHPAGKRPWSRPSLRLPASAALPTAVLASFAVRTATP